MLTFATYKILGRSILIRGSATALVVLCAATFLSPFSVADNWPHWRGENGNGVSTTANPPVDWTSNPGSVKWKTEIPGQGSGSPIIWEDKVFVVTAVPVAGTKTLDFQLMCFDRNSGQLNWTQTAANGKPAGPTHSTNNYAPASPCTDGDHVYAHFGSQGTFCFTMDGQPVWSRTDFGVMQTRNGFGEGSSPTLDGDYLFVPWDHEGPSSLYCLDKQTGQTVWKTARDEPTNWATPLIVEHDGKKQVIMNGQSFARSYDYETGKEIWRCDGQTQRPAASPVHSDDTVFVGSGFRGAYLGAFDLDGTNDIEDSEHVRWTINRNTPDVASLLLSENRLYFYKAKVGLLSCVDAVTGKPFYTAQRIPNLDTIYASPVAAGGHVYLSDRDGTVVVIKDSPELQIVATNQLTETIDATPAPVDNELFIRSSRFLYCIER